MGAFLNRWFIGYVILRMSGKYVERFINLAIKAGLEMWDISRSSNQHFRMKVRLKHFFKLKPILRETSTKMEIERKVGLPFILYRLDRRKGIFVGFFIFILMLYMLSSMIWKIEITGTDQISRSTVLEAAEKVGIRPTAFKWRLKPLEQMQYDMLNVLPDASWVGIKIDGVVAKITVVEKVRPEKKELVNPRHLVAKKKAVIHDIFVEQGLPKVKPNQFVKKGDILISGILGPENNPEKQKVVSAKGDVWGEVWYESTISVPLNQEIHTLTGESKISHYLILGKYAIKMWGYGKKPMMEQFKVEEERDFLYFRDYKLPIGWEQEKQLEYVSSIKSISKEEAIKIALESGRKNILIQAGEGSKIKEENVLQQWEENDKVYIKVHYAVIEEIAEEQIILGNPSNSTKQGD